MGKYRVETSGGTYEVELADRAAGATFAGNDMLDFAQPTSAAGKAAASFRNSKFLDFMPQANIARRAMNPEDIPGHLANLGEVTGVAPSFEYPRMAAAAGPSGAAIAAGANAAVGALNQFPNSLLNELYLNPPELEPAFKRSFELPKSQTATGRALDAATTAIAAVAPFAMENVALTSKMQALMQRTQSLEAARSALEANQARAGSVVKPMELTSPGATTKDINATEAAWKDAHTQLLREKQAVIDREHVAFDNRLLDNMRSSLIQSRRRAAAWLKEQGEIWSGRFETAAAGKEIPREEASGLLDGMAQRMGLIDDAGMPLKVNLTPSEARVMRLRNAYSAAGEEAAAPSGLVDAGGAPIPSTQQAAVSDQPLSLQQLYKELLGTKQLRGAPHVDDYALGQAKNYLAEFLAERGDADFVNLRTSYGPFAKFRDQIYKFIKPQAGTYDTDAAVNELRSLLDAASDINPSQAKNTGDLRAFMREYSQIDPDMSSSMQIASRTKRSLNMAKVQLEAQMRERFAAKQPVFDELRRRALETYDQTLQRYVKAYQSAKTEVDRLYASKNLGTFLRRYVLSPTVRELPRALRLGAELSAAGYVASRVLGGRVERE